MENGKSSAYPVIWDRERNELEPGLTKREYFAGLAMQGLISSELVLDSDTMQYIVTRSVQLADVLLKELEK